MLIPYTLTVIVIGLALIVSALLLRAGWKYRGADRNGPAATPGVTATNRWIRGLRVVLAAALVTVFGFHSYWVFRAGSLDDFRRAKAVDQRNRRLAESGLKGWVFDRSGRLENALIRYRYDGRRVEREYPLGAAAVHLTGFSDFVFGSGGIEYAFRDWLTESTSSYNRLVSPVPVGKDLKVSIDSELQRYAHELLVETGKSAASIVLLLPNNEVLAMNSTPGFDPYLIRTEAAWRSISEQADRTPLVSPLVNRSLGTLVTGGSAFYYRPGSTFKTFTAAVAIESGMDRERFLCRPEGYTAPGSGRAIRDFGGSVHGRIGLDEAFRVSCNQYFAQLGVHLGRERLSTYAHRLGFLTAPGQGSPRAQSLWSASKGSRGDFNYVFAPPASRMNLSESASSYDLALQAIGQGFDDMTVLAMALLASAVGVDGSLAAPTLEAGEERKGTGPFVTAATSQRLKALMRGVVESGTASTAFSLLRGRIDCAGKTGTADRVVPLLDSEGKPVVDRVEEDGRVIYKTQGWADGWFIGFAPAADPKIAFAVIVENGGEGSRSAAPIAARIVQRAAALGYLSRR